MSNLPLQPLKWVDHTTVDYIDHRAQGAGVLYRVCHFADKFRVYWVDSMGGSDGNKEFDSLDELKYWVNTDHYPHKMQPYVKPSPTKVFELTYDCGDSYATLFMTTDKQSAIDFMESVKDADRDFISSYGFDDDADELLVKQYDDNHPLKPYAREIFESIYEDSFSEWAMSYAGSSLVSQMSIIEHELFVKQGE